MPNAQSEHGLVSISAQPFKAQSGARPQASRRHCGASQDVAGADVLLTNVRPQALDRLGLSWETLSAANPRLIYMRSCWIRLRRPLRRSPDLRRPDPGANRGPSILVDAGSEAPHYVPTSFNDRGVGLHSAIIMLSALLQRLRTGKGQQIEVPMFETMVHSVLGDHMGARLSGRRLVHRVTSVR